MEYPPKTMKDKSRVQMAEVKLDIIVSRYLPKCVLITKLKQQQNQNSSFIVDTTGRYLLI